MDDSPFDSATDNSNTGFGRRRPSTLRFAVSVAAACAAVLALYLWQPGWFSAPGFTKPAPVVKVAPTPTPRPSAPHYPYLGHTWKIDNLWITPLTLRFTHGNGNTQADAGDTFAIVTLRVENHQGKDYPLVPNINCPVALCNYYVRDSEGRKNPPVAFDPYHTSMRPVVLQPGGYLEGSYTFEVPEHDARNHTLQLLYYHDPLGDANNVIHWLLKPAPTHAR